MSRFSQYLDKDYLPGEVYESTLGAARFEPVAVQQALAEKKFKFKPDQNDGTYFQRFMALQNNPELLSNQAFGSSPDFFKAMSMFGGSGYN